MPFQDEDAIIAYDTLSANRPFAGAADLAVLGTLVFAGATRHSVSVMVPDCLLPPENNTVRVCLCHSRKPLGEHAQYIHRKWTTDNLQKRRQRAMQKGKRQQVSGLGRGDQDQHGPPHPAETHNVPVFLAVPGTQLFAVVQI